MSNPDVEVNILGLDGLANIQATTAGDVVITTGDANATGVQLVVRKNGGAEIGGDTIATQVYVDAAVDDRVAALDFASKAYVDQKVAASQPSAGTAPAWIAASMYGGWVNNGPTAQYAQASASYRKRPDGKVELQGLVKGTTAGTNIFNLPVGYRPSTQKAFAIVSAANGDSFASVKVQPNGNVLFASGNPGLVFLNDIEFSLD